MQFLKKWEVYTHVTYEECKKRTGKAPIKTKWVQTNKGDDINLNIRRRWVAREFRTNETIFAATAPYETIRMCLSLVVFQEECRYSGEAKKHGGEIWRDYQVELKHPRSPNDPDRTQISLMDVRRAYFNAMV